MKVNDDTKLLIAAAKHADWMQVVLNQGPPCFHLEDDGHFCLRAERWDGHGDGENDIHPFVPLANLLASAFHVVAAAGSVRVRLWNVMDGTTIEFDLPLDGEESGRLVVPKGVYEASVVEPRKGQGK